MTIELGFGGSSQKNPSIVYFNIYVPTDGSTKKVEQYQASNEGNHVTIPDDFAVNLVQLAAVPDGVHVTVHFESKNLKLNETTTKVDLPGPGLALGNATVMAVEVISRRLVTAIR